MLELQIIGNLGADAQVKDFNGRKAIAFNVAHTERYTDAQNVQHETTTWVSCLWNSEGGRLLPYLKKGSQVFVSGRASVRIYDSAQAHGKVAGLNCQVKHIELVGGKKEEQQAPAPQENNENAPF